MTEPTDTAIDTLILEHGVMGQAWPTQRQLHAFARAVLAKWGTPPAVAGEKVYLVATGLTNEAGTVGLYERHDRFVPLADCEVLYATPQPAVAAGWMSVKDRLPEACKPVLLDIGRKYPIRALWAPKFTLPTDGDVDYGEYDEATDDYYCHEGWYEWNQNEETHWAVNETPCAWCELPKTIPPAPSTEGEKK